MQRTVAGAAVSRHGSTVEGGDPHIAGFVKEAGPYNCEVNARSPSRRRSARTGRTRDAARLRSFTLTRIARESSRQQSGCSRLIPP